MVSIVDISCLLPKVFLKGNWVSIYSGWVFIDYKHRKGDPLE